MAMICSRKIILIIFLINLIGEIAYSQWKVENIPTTANLNSISINQGTAWIVGDGGTMLFRNIYGWMPSIKVTDQNLYSVFLTGPNSGWAVGSNGTILYYDGQSWTICDSPTRSTLYSVSFSNEDTGIAVGEQGTVILFRKGLWVLQERITVGDLYAATLLDQTAIFAGGRENVSIPVMMSPVDQILTNPIVTFDPGYINVRSLACIDGNNVWAVGKPGTIFFYNGRDWRRINTGQRLPSLNSIAFAGNTFGLAVGYYGTIMTFSEKGWKKELSPTKMKLNGTAISGNTFYAVGNNGILISSERLTESPKESTQLLSERIVIETYPNPTSGLLKVIIPQELDSESGTITISNFYGQVVMIDEFDNPGSGQDYQINATNFGRGIYIINITTSKLKASGKFVISD